LLIVIRTDNKESILNFPLQYGGVSLSREYWKRVHNNVLGASITQASDSQSVRKKVTAMQKEGVEFSACVVCAQEY
jgi:hypothetical protein